MGATQCKLGETQGLVDDIKRQLAEAKRSAEDKTKEYNEAAAAISNSQTIAATVESLKDQIQKLTEDHRITRINLEGENKKLSEKHDRGISELKKRLMTAENTMVNTDKRLAEALGDPVPDYRGMKCPESVEKHTDRLISEREKLAKQVQTMESQLADVQSQLSKQQESHSRAAEESKKEEQAKSESDREAQAKEAREAEFRDLRTKLGTVTEQLLQAVEHERGLNSYVKELRGWVIGKSIVDHPKAEDKEPAYQLNALGENTRSEVLRLVVALYSQTHNEVMSQAREKVEKLSESVRRGERIEGLLAALNASKDRLEEKGREAARLSFSSEESFAAESRRILDESKKAEKVAMQTLNAISDELVAETGSKAAPTPGASLVKDMGKEELERIKRQIYSDIEQRTIKMRMKEAEVRRMEKAATATVERYEDLIKKAEEEKRAMNAEKRRVEEDRGMVRREKEMFETEKAGGSTRMIMMTGFCAVLFAVVLGMLFFGKFR